MKNKKLLSITFGSAFVLSTTAAVPVLTNNTNLNKNFDITTLKNIGNDAAYAPLTIKEDCLNANTIVSDGSFKAAWLKAHAVDVRSDKIISKVLEDGTEANPKTACTWFTKKCTSDTTIQAHAMEDPTNGIVKVTSGNSSTDGLFWNIPNVGVEDESHNLKNNSIKIWYDSTDPTKQTKNITFTSTQCGSTLYFLASAANLTGDSAELTVKCNYSDGTSSKDLNFAINDWGQQTTELAAAEFYRSRGEGYIGQIPKTHGVDTDQTYHLSQCSVTLNPKKVLKDIKISCGPTTTKGVTNNMVMTIYGVSCKTNDLLPPTSVTSTSPTKVGTTLSWTASGSETTVGYKLDIATDNEFLNYVEGFEDIQIASSKETTTYTISSGLEPGKTYHARIRSINANGEQSPHSNIATFTTNQVDSTKIELNGMPQSIVKGKEFTVTTKVVGETIEGKEYKYPNQNISWAWTPNDSITQKSSEEFGDGRKYVFLGNTCRNCVITADASDKKAQQQTRTLVIKPDAVNALGLQFSEQLDNAIIATWTKVDNEAQYRLTVANDENFTDIVFGPTITNVGDETAIIQDGKINKNKSYYVKIEALENDIPSDPFVAIIGSIPGAGGLSTGAIAGIATGATAGAALAVFLPIGLVKHKKNKDGKNKKK